MNPLAFAISLPAAFLAGVLAHKYILSEAQSIKTHVTAEIQEVRADIASLLSKVGAKV